MLMAYSLSRLAAGMITATLPLIWLPYLPEARYNWVPVALAGILIAVKKGKEAAIFLMLFLWALMPAQRLLQQTTFLSAGPVNATVRIKQLLPQSQKIKVRIVSVGGKRLFPPVYALINSPEINQAFCAGQRWQMTLRLRPVHARLNQGGFDAQRFALANSTPLTGKALALNPVDLNCSWRESIIQRSQKHLQTLPWQSVLLALAFGDRTTLSSEIKTVLRETGTAHLMAISGMHIGLAASSGWLLARIIQLFFRSHWIGYRFPLGCGLALALIYSWLSGGSPPAVRAILALTIWSLLRLTGKNCTSGQVLNIAIGTILFFDPLSVLSDSLWLSATAVASLLLWYHWFPLAGRFSKQKKWLLLRLLHLQLGLFVLLMPLQIFIFHGISVSALLANLWAVPLVTLLTVPLLLGAILLLPCAPLSQFLWWLADCSLALVFKPLFLLPKGWIGVSEQVLWLSLFCLLMMAVCRFHWWHSSPLTVVSFCLALLCWRLNIKEPEWRLDMLDIGHGLSIVISQRGKAVIYDTGNRWGSGDAALSQIVPWLRWQRLTVQQIILSHGHLDHIGGLNSLRANFPAATIRSGLNLPGHLPCQKNLSWRWQSLTFKVLWPQKMTIPSGNNQSCVILVSDGKRKILLTGDIETPAELKLISFYGDRLRADIIQVPHHGSGTSSSPPLLRKVAGSVALASAARYNAWKLPAKRIITRYHENHYRWYDTAADGQITLEFYRENWRVLTYRAQIMPRWYHQWFGVTRYSR